MCFGVTFLVGGVLGGVRVLEAKGNSNDELQVSAADYDPNIDRQQEEDRRAWAARKQEATMDIVEASKLSTEETKEEGVAEEEVEEEEEDDLDDMFAVDPSPKKKKTSKVKKPVSLLLMEL